MFLIGAFSWGRCRHESRSIIRAFSNGHMIKTTGDFAITPAESCRIYGAAMIPIQYTRLLDVAGAPFFLVHLEL